MLPRVYADFQKLDDFNRLELICHGTLEDFKRINLQEGMKVIFYSDDIEIG